MKNLQVVAFDLSLTSTGYAIGKRTNETVYGTLCPLKLKGMERLRWIRDEVLLLSAKADVVLVEGYSYASRGAAIVSLGELGGVIRLALFDAGHKVVEIPPANRVMYATGKGNSAKEAVLVAAVRRLRYQGVSHDEADALWLLAMAKDAYDLPGKVKLGKSHRRALKKIDWKCK